MNKIFNEDCLNGMRKHIPDNYVDVAISSPPFKNSDGCLSIPFLYVFNQIYRVLKPNSLFFLEFGHLSEDKFRPFAVCMRAIEAGFKLKDTICWQKNHFTPLPGNNLNNLTEFIFMLYKGGCPKLNRLSIGVPYDDISNAKRYNNGVNLRCQGNVWKINVPTITKSSQRKHPDEFPIELPERCIKLSNIPKNSIVLDVFMGGGTTALAAKNLGMQYIGFEINPKHCETARQRGLNC